MDMADFRAYLRCVSFSHGRRWLGPRTCERIRTMRRGWQRRRRARAQMSLRAWVSKHAVDEAPEYATWMLSANVPGSDRALAWFRDAIELPVARDSWRTSENRLIAASIAHHAARDEEIAHHASQDDERQQEAAAVAAEESPAATRKT